MEPRKVMITEKQGNGYRLRVFLFLGLKLVFSYFWPVLLQHTPEEVEEYISRTNLPKSLAESLRLWFFSGYSIYENGYFLGRESGSALDYVSAYRLVQRNEYPMKKTTPMDFYLISTYRRPDPGVLQESVLTVLSFAEKHGATPEEEADLWEWVYSGNSIHKNPCGEDEFDYIAWRRDFHRRMTELSLEWNAPRDPIDDDGIIGSDDLSPL